MAELPLPIACTLSRGDMETRAGELRQLGRDALASSTVRGSTAVLRFRGDRETRERVAAVAAAEADCCAFLEFQVEDENAATVLTISGPPEAAEAVGHLARAFGEA